MRYFIVCFIVSVFLFHANVYAKKEKEYKGPPRTEGELIGKIINCLQWKDTNTYNTLFLEFDTVWKQVIEYMPHDVADARSINNIRQHPEKVQQFDPYYNHEISRDFYSVVKKAQDSGIHWNQVLLMRFELQKQRLTRDMVGYELIAPIRYQGYVFIEDMLSKMVYIFTVNEIQKICGYWYGGQVVNIYPASSVEEFQVKLAADVKRRRMMREFGLTEEDLAKIENSKDSTKHKIKASDADDEETPSTSAGLMKKDIVDRKYYIGKFDNEIPVKLYVRYIKGNCPGGVCAWEAIYKFGDQDEFIKLDVSRTSDGKWIFNEDPPIGSMELMLNDKLYTGNWASSDIKTGYDVKLTETPISAAMVKQLDHIIERGAWAKGLKEDKPKDENKDKDGRIKAINEDIINGVN